MRTRRLIIIAFLLVTTTCAFAPAAFAGPPEPKYSANQELCELYMRYGAESFARGRYHDAKYYFQKAVQADPGSTKAWNYYDLASFYSVGERMKDEGKYVFRPTEPSVQPEISASTTPKESSEAKPSAQPTPAPAKPKTGFKIMDDEGC